MRAALHTRAVAGLFFLSFAACGADDAVTAPDPGLTPEHLIGLWTLSLSGTCGNEPVDVLLQIVVEGATIDSSRDTRLRFVGHIEFQGDDLGDFEGLADRPTGVFVVAASWIQLAGTVRTTGSMEGEWEDPDDASSCAGDFRGNKNS